MQCLVKGCTKHVSLWRSCGAGCKLQLVYCSDHGGDDRAREEMVQHRLAMHPEVVP